MKGQAWNLFNDLDDYWVEIVDARHTEREVNFVKKSGRPGRILDLCCGTGRHSILLCSQGWDVIGLDISPNLLKKAKVMMLERKSYFPIIRADMRHLPFRNETFSTIMNVFTSFGYLESEDEDIKCLSEIARTLKTNGIFLLDVANKEHLVATFRSKDWGEFDSFYLLEERQLDTNYKMLHSKWILVNKRSGEIEIFKHCLRLYSLKEIKKMLNKVDLRILNVDGDYNGGQFDSNSSRMIVSAYRDISVF